MRMTINGSNDQHIRMQGVDAYTFCDADGGAAGAESDEEGVDLEEQAQQEADVLIPVDSSDDEVAEDTDGEGEGEGEDEYEDGELDSSDEEDDTADISSVANAIGNAAAPEGWKVIKEAPALNTEPELQALIGKHILYGHDSRAATGWFIGCVHSRNLTARDLKQAPTANFVVCYTAKLTDKKLVGKVACELSSRTHGPTEWWVLVEKAGAGAGPSGAGEAGAAEATGATTLSGRGKDRA
jgi:hypothetical protein